MKEYRYVNNKKSNKGKYLISGILILLAIIISIYFWGTNQNKSSLNDDNKEQQQTEENTADSANNQITEDQPEESQNGESTTEPVEENNVDITNGGYIEGQPEPTEPTYVDGILIANKKYPLPSNFAPGENKDAREAFEKMAVDAKELGFVLVAFSTYRSYEYQETLYNKYVERDGKENADRYSARPGYSEHQTGFAFDIGEKGKEDLWLTEEFGETPAGKWLVENAHKYGFILRYPKGKEAITGYMYESWHFRYLGVDLAAKVKASNLTLEEYLNIQ
ncbi:D-alanyl-D-alanine carboxypeptidase [Ureibacillus xyleni]|uniref:D-alanyl-D-alanine carboxypeptidase n=1 Tax=Ureibacillus xyleni TaxID=614648 RepID=A0A285TAI9_9BACL|nr:M15 family metallopeptidase [Ureibacillus xyleni]SOC18497.1 D-alanyl-D-alanine carboxypeptidase [Ureibacillus xyleni]